MRLLLFLLLVFSVSLKSTAQNLSLTQYQLQSDTVTRQEINNSYWYILDDEEGNFTIEDVIKEPLAGKFFQIGNNQRSTSAFVSTHWIRYAVKNAMNHEAEICFYTAAEKSDFYIFRQNNKKEHFITGTTYPWSKKDGFKKANAIPWKMVAGEEVTVYQRRYNKRPDSLNATTKLVLLSAAKLRDAEFKDYEENSVDQSYIFTGFISGMFFLAALFNLLIFWQLKNRENLYFSLFLLSMFFLYNPFFTGIIGREYIKLKEIFTLLGISFLIFFVLFIRTYFQLSLQYPRWSKFLSLLPLTYCIVIVISLFQLSPSIDDLFILLRQIVLFVYAAALVISVLLSIRKGDEKTKIFIRAVLPFLLMLIIPILVLILMSIIYPHFLTEKLTTILNYSIAVSIVWAVVVFSTYLYKNYGLQQQKIMEGLLLAERMEREKEHEKNEFIRAQKDELEKQVAERTLELSNSLDVLKSTQSQLIQSEKMASLGELTAGIAHEIQNPLNFVNNFSDVNQELAEELEQEAEKGNLKEVQLIARDIKDNESKINFHGKRADAIVKNMLQHSRAAGGMKEPTNINALADEYLRLAYHGLRAKDKSFNADLQINLDNSLGLVNVIPQEIGRVLLNLFNNAFYAVLQKTKTGLRDYHPVVGLKTIKSGGNVEITVTDNGNGIPEGIKDKIFQPFFTTKPTGEGTGLGLSLSYDIVKAHGGKLVVTSAEGEGSGFTISLPA
jgi:two-component system, NtrC family, sensor kinase